MKLLLLSLIIMAFTACGESSTATSNHKLKSEKEDNTIMCKDIYNETIIKKVLKNVQDFEETSAKEKYCAYKFKIEGMQYYTHLSVGGLKHANLAMLEQSMSMFKTVTFKPIEGVGEKAYVSTVGGGQISAFSNGNLIHVALSANAFEEEKTKLLTNAIFEKLNE